MSTTRSKIEFIEKVARTSAEYRDILPFFAEMYSTIDGREDATGIELSPSLSHLEEKIAAGFPLLDRDDLRLDRSQAVSFASFLIEAMIRGGRQGEDSLHLLAKRLQDGELDLLLLAGASLARERAPLAEAAERTGIPAALIEFVIGTMLRTALQHFIAHAQLPSFGHWKESFCPICGGRAGMAELAGEEGRRFLSCSCCSFSWSFSRLKCPYCGTDDPEHLSYFQVGEEGTRVDVCAKCSRYIKTRDSRKGDADVPLEATDLVTLHLDMLAVREGYERGK